MAVSDDFATAVSAFGDIGNLWDCFAIVHSKGIDGKPVFAAILPKIVGLGCGILVLMLLLRIIESLSRQMDSDESPALLGIAAEAVLLGVLLVAYDPLLLLLPHLFDTVAHSLSRLFAADLSSQLAGALEVLGNEKTTDFKFWTAQGMTMTVLGLLSAMLSFAALILMWVMGKLQGYLFTFWYLLGPLALPTLLFAPLRRIGKIWLSSFLGTAFMSITGSVFYFILVRSTWISKIFASGVASDYVTCLVYSLLGILTLVMIPIISLRVWSGIEVGAATAVGGAQRMMKKGTGFTATAATKARALADQVRTRLRPPPPPKAT